MIQRFAYERAIQEICDLNWKDLSAEELAEAAWAYYFFSIQFRENLEIACELYPDDHNLRQLKREECDTDNLSPWPEVAAIGEKMNHDEFMGRLLKLSALDEGRQAELESLGGDYLRFVRESDPTTRALSIASYEDGGLEKVFRAILGARHWDSPLLRAFKHFLTEHIRFDSNPEQGHGALSRHLTPDDRVLPLWIEFRRILVGAVPRLSVEARHGR